MVVALAAHRPALQPAVKRVIHCKTNTTITINCIMKTLKNYLAIIYKNWRTSFAAFILLVSTWFFVKQTITSEQFLILMGFCGSLGLFLSKDGQTQKEYDKEQQKGA
jgi:hypothetical protein